MGKCVSVHCVKAQGPLFELLKKLGPKNLPPRIMMHSWGGSVDSARSLLCLKGGVGQRIYFSFSATINAVAPKTPAVIRSIPDDRLLIESDHVEEVDKHMLEAVALVAKAKDWTTEFCVQQMLKNSQ